MSEWINVKTLPELEEDVVCKRFLVCSITGEVPTIMLFFAEENRWSIHGDDTQKITCWQPLSKSPEEN